MLHTHILDYIDKICARTLQSLINPRPCEAFYSIQLVGGGGVGPPSRSAPDGPRASRKKWSHCPQKEEADGIQFYGLRSAGDLRGQVKHPNLVTWDGDLADAIKPTKASESLSKWLRTVQITLILTLGVKMSPKVILGQWPQMTSDDLDTWRVKYSVFIGADLESDIHFALSNHPDAQIRKKKTANWSD